MKVSKETLEKIAHLARLEINPKDEDRLLKDLNNILDWVDKLDEVNTDGVEPLRHMSEEINAFREDEGQNTLDRKKAINLSPDHDEEFFKVPKVIKDK